MAWCHAVRVATYMPVTASGGRIRAYSSVVPPTGLVGFGVPVWGVAGLWRAGLNRG